MTDTSYFKTPQLADTDTGGNGLGSIAFGDFGLGMVMAFFGGIDFWLTIQVRRNGANDCFARESFYDVDVRQANALAYY